VVSAFTLNNGPISYVYDELGRLVGVIGNSGNAAVYNYDAVGDISGIDTSLNREAFCAHLSRCRLHDLYFPAT
jgi:YD repeat-containing protein